MANKIFIQDPQLNIAASVPAAVNIGVQNVDTSSPIIGQFGQMLAQMVGQYQANKQQIDYADMQFELDQLEKQWHLNNTADPNVYKTEESRGNLAKSLNERLLQEQDIINKYRDKIGDENYYNFSKQFQLKLADEMAAIQTGINQGFIGEEYTRAVRRIDNNLDKVNDYKNVFNANDGALVLMQGHNLATSSLKYLNADDNETIYKGYENYFGTLQKAFQTNFIQDLYDNFSDGNGMLDIEASKDYYNKLRVGMLSEDNISPVAKELYKNSPNLFNDEQDTFNYVKKKYEDTFNDIEKFISKRKVEKEKDMALVKQHNFYQSQQQANEILNKFASNIGDKYDGTNVSKLAFDKSVKDGVYGNNREWDNVPNPLTSGMFPTTFSNAILKGVTLYGDDNLQYMIIDNLKAALLQEQKSNPSFNANVVSIDELQLEANNIIKDLYSSGEYDIQNNPVKMNLLNTKIEGLKKEYYERNQRYNLIKSQMENQPQIASLINQLTQSEESSRYPEAVIKFYERTGIKNNMISWYEDKMKIKIDGDKFATQIPDVYKKQYLSSLEGQQAIAVAMAAILQSRIDTPADDFLNAKFDQIPKTDYLLISQNIMLSVGKDIKGGMNKDREKYLKDYFKKNYGLVQKVNGSNIGNGSTLNINEDMRNSTIRTIMNANGNTNKEEFNKELTTKVLPNDKVRSQVYNEKGMKGQVRDSQKEPQFNGTSSFSNEDIGNKVLSKQKKRTFKNNEAITNLVY